MKAMAVDGYGPLDRLRPIDVPKPVPGPGEVRVRVIASALNPADFKVILGSMKFLHGRRMPLIVGSWRGRTSSPGSRPRCLTTRPRPRPRRASRAYRASLRWGGYHAKGACW